MGETLDELEIKNHLNNPPPIDVWNTTKAEVEAKMKRVRDQLDTITSKIEKLQRVSGVEKDERFARHTTRGMRKVDECGDHLDCAEKLENHLASK